MKLFRPVNELSAMLPWVATVPEALVRFIGASELLAAIGLLLPSILRIQPKLTVYAAAGLLAIMILATIFHISKGKYSALGITLFIGAIALFVTWGRSKKLPIAAK